MLKRLIVGLISITLLFQSLVFSSPVYASPVITTENSQAVHKIPFSNSIEFYKKLNKALKSNEPIVIQTDFKNYDEFPKDLKKIVKVDPSNSSIGAVGAASNLMMPATAVALGGAVGAGALSSAAIGKAVGAGLTGALPGGIGGLAGSPNLIASGWLDNNPLNFMTWTAIGAGIGGAIGVLPGGILALPAAGIGAGVGATASIVSQAFNDSTHRVILTIGLGGTITITIEPASFVA
jgi:hypothetical protein